MREVVYTGRGWFGKVSAGAVLGFFLSLGCCGVFAVWGPGDVGFFSAQSQLTMWLMAPLWCGVLSFCFLFRSGPSAWLWLGGANLLVWSAVYAPALLAVIDSSH